MDNVKKIDITRRTEFNLLGLKIVRSKYINIERLIEAANAKAKDRLSLQASAEGESEASAEELIKLFAEAGTLQEVERDPETGEIVSFRAGRNQSPFVYEPEEPDEVSDVIASIQATGPAPQKLLGDLAQTSVTTIVNATASTTTSSTTITFSSAPGVSGGPISGAGIPAGATVAIVGTAGTLSVAATATGAAVAMVITAETQVIGLAEWTLDWKRKTADATTTDDDTYESSLGSTASWSVKAKYIFVDADPSQSTNILATITSPQSPAVWNFFPTIATGRAAFNGSAYVDGITMATGMGKVVGLDVSLKGTGKLNFTTQLAPVANPNTGTGEQAED